MTCRQPTIRSLFFVIAIVAILSALAQQGELAASEFDPMDIAISVAMWLMPVMSPLFIKGNLRMLLPPSAMVLLGLSCMFYELKYPQLQLPMLDKVVLGMFWPAFSLVDIYVVIFQPDRLWLEVAGCSCFYLAITPFFAWTCRLRPTAKP